MLAKIMRAFTDRDCIQRHSDGVENIHIVGNMILLALDLQVHGRTKWLNRKDCIESTCNVRINTNIAFCETIEPDCYPRS